MGKPKVKIKGQPDVNDGRGTVVHPYNREIQHLGKPKVKIKVNTKAANGENEHKLEEKDTHCCTSGKKRGKPKVKIRQVRDLWMGKPKVKMKKTKRKDQ